MRNKNKIKIILTFADSELEKILQVKLLLSIVEFILLRNAEPARGIRTRVPHVDSAEV